MEKEIYEELMMEVIRIDRTDTVTASGNPDDETEEFG